MTQLQKILQVTECNSVHTSQVHTHACKHKSIHTHTLNVVNFGTKKDGKNEKVLQWNICMYEQIELYCSSDIVCACVRVYVCMCECLSSLTSSHMSPPFLQLIRKFKPPQVFSFPLVSDHIKSSCFFFFLVSSLHFLSSLLLSSPLLTSPPLTSFAPPPLSYLSVLVKGQCEHKGLLW